MIRAIDTVSQHRLDQSLAKGRYQFNEDGELEKRCSRCGDYWPADTEFFFAQLHSSHKDGLHCMCKDCNIQARGRTPRMPARPVSYTYHRETNHV